MDRTAAWVAPLPVEDDAIRREREGMGSEETLEMARPRSAAAWLVVWMKQVSRL